MEKNKKVITVNLTIKDKLDYAKEKLVEFKDNTIKFCKEHKEVLIPLIPVFIGVGGKIIGFVAKQITIHNQKEVKDLYCYDRSLGHYWKLRRELTNDEWVRIDKRKKDGERLADILDEMKVLK